MCIAGVTCKDYSTMNHCRRGHLGPSGEVLLVFLYEVRHMKYDIVLMECVEHQDLDPVINLLSEFYSWSSFTFGPEQIGWWRSRPRRSSVFVLRPEYGGKLRLRLNWGIFKELFSAERAPDLDGGVFAVSEPTRVMVAVGVGDGQG